MIIDAEGVRFLQSCLPRLRLRWAGFRKVRRQIYKRLNRRLLELRLTRIESYKTYLEGHPDEWTTLDMFCWISISRFYRDQAVFEHLEREILPVLARLEIERGETELRCWSAGCAGGEEPYTVALLWYQTLARQFPTIRLRIIATDIDSEAIHRAKLGCYRASSLKQLPPAWRAQAFTTSGDQLCLKEPYRDKVTFLVQDLRESVPDGLFQLALCRNLAFTYFDEQLQQEILRKLTSKLSPGGALIIGKLERLPKETCALDAWSLQMGVYRKPLAHSFHRNSEKNRS